MARLAVAAGIAGVLTAGAAPALAADSISKFSGNANGQAIAVQVNPSTVLDVRLNRLQQIIDSLDTTGIPGSVKNTVGSTLANPTSPINVAVDSAAARGVSVDGTKLSDGSASSTAVAIDAKSLESEVSLLNQAVQNMPDGTVKALQSALGPIVAKDPSGQLSAALNTYLPELSHPVTGTLGSPSVNVFQSVSARFGEDNTGNLTTVEKNGLLTPKSSLALQPFEARALPSDAFATNAVDNLNLVPSGQLGLASPSQLAAALKAIDTALISVEKTLSTVAGQTGAGTVTDAVTGTVFPLINTTVDTAGTQVQGVDLSAVNGLINSLTSALSGIDGLALNDIVGNNGANALSSISRSGNVVTASGLGAVAHVDIVKINKTALPGQLASLLNADELASVDGIKATANVSLDGVHPATQSANGSLVDVNVLGKPLESYVPASAGKVSLDDILPAGTTCTINIPGASTCHGIQLLDSVSSLPQLQAIQDTIKQNVPTLVSVTLTRGLGVVDQSKSSQYGRADITVLQVTGDINCSALNQVSGALSVVGSPLAKALDLHAAACGVGITDAAPAAGANALGAHNASANSVGTARLVSASFGVAHAELGLNTTSATACTGVCGGTLPPNTGNDIFILAGLSVAAVAAGLGLQVLKARARRA